MDPLDFCSPNVNHLSVFFDEAHLPFFRNLLVSNQAIYVHKPILKFLKGLISVVVTR